jgi:UDP-glucose 4-epimerase
LDTIKINLPDLAVNYTASKETDVKDFCLDISLMQSLINFEFTPFEEAIQKTISWEKLKLHR